MTRVPASAALLLVALLLAGCAAPAEGEADTAAHGEEASTGEASTDEVDADGNVLLPLSFPYKEVPLLEDHTLLHVINSGGIWGVWLESSDFAGDLAAATAQLTAFGYTQVTADPAYADFENAGFEIRVLPTDDKYGPSLYYLIKPTSTPVEEQSDSSETESGH